MILLLFLVIAILPSGLPISPQYSLSQSKDYAQLSSLAYCSAACLESWSCGSAKGIALSNVSYLNNGSAVSCFVGFRIQNNQIVASFRGRSDFDAWFRESDLSSVPYPACGDDCTVRKDFNHDYQEIHKLVEEKVVKLIAKYPTASLLATGHGLGGSVAMIGGLKLKEKFPSQKM